MTVTMKVASDSRISVLSVFGEFAQLLMIAAAAGLCMHTVARL